MAKGQSSPIITMALLIGGAAVGAGILGLPVQTGLAGMLPALAGLVLMWAAGLASAWVIAGAYLRLGDTCADLPTLFARELGTWAKWLTVAGYLVNYYGIMVAYLAGAAAVLGSLLGLAGRQSLLVLAFFLPATAACLFGNNLVRRINAALMVALLASLATLLALTLGHLQPTHLAYADWGFLPATLPIITCSLAFHNLVPLTCRQLGGRRRDIFKAMLLGSALPALLGGLCILAVLGALPLEGSGASLISAFRADQPATIPLAAALSSPAVTTAGLVFSLSAILTSYLAVAAGLMGFWRDLAGPLLAGRGRAPRALITFAPPLAVTLLWPDLFLSALNLAGGLGLGLFIGLAPALVLILRRPPDWRWSPRFWGICLLVVFGAVILLELGQELGLTHIAPQVENWTSYQPR